MLRLALVILLAFLFPLSSYAQNSADEKAIRALIDQYAQAREQQDTVLLKSILTQEVDQLVSSGTWRRGIEGAMQGMMRSSRSNPGERVLTVENIRFMNAETALVDARYEIKNSDEDIIRKMWSTFVVVYREDSWKITAIRNMLPAK